jgi:hypothetical protein
VEPALIALARGRRTRVFEDKSVPEILKEVLGAPLRERGRSLCFASTRSYPRRERCAQYRESDLVFASRLMQEERIVYRFDHEGEKELLLLQDTSGRLDEAGDLGSLRVRAVSLRSLRGRPEGILQGSTAELAVRPGRRVALGAPAASKLDWDPVVVASTHLFGERAGAEREGGIARPYLNELEVASSAQVGVGSESLRRPQVAGIRIATVVEVGFEEGGSGLGDRVKVRFVPESAGEGGSCWVRVAPASPSDGRGGSHLPPVGAEVMIAFVDGDPDRPRILSWARSGLREREELWGRGASAPERRGGGEAVGSDLRTEVGRDEMRCVGRSRHTVIESREVLEVGISRATTIGVRERLSVAHLRTVEVPPTSIEMAKKSKSIVLDTGAGARIRLVKDNVFIEAEGEIFVSSPPREEP